MRKLRFERLEDRNMMATDLAWSINIPGGDVLETDGENTYLTANVPYGDVLFKYDADGNEVWSWNSGGGINRMYFDDDAIFVLHDSSVAKLTTDGEVIWDKSVAVGIISEGLRHTWGRVDSLRGQRGY